MLCVFRARYFVLAGVLVMLLLATLGYKDRLQEGGLQLRRANDHKLFPSQLRCVQHRGGDMAAPLLSNVRVDITSNSDASSSQDRLMTIHICGEDAERVKVQLEACRPVHWKPFTMPTPDSVMVDYYPWYDGKALVLTKIVTHPLVDACHQSAEVARAENPSGPVVLVHDDAWLTVRYGMDNQYHGLYDQGLMQSWATWWDVVSAADQHKKAKAGESEPSPGDVDDEVLIHDYEESFGGYFRRRLPLLSIRDMWFRGHFPFHDLWPMALPVNVTTLSPASHTRIYARRLLLSHYDVDVAGFPRLQDGHVGLPKPIAEMLLEFARFLRLQMSEAFGDPGIDAAVLFETRPSADEFNHQNRARGLNGELQDEMAAALIPMVAHSSVAKNFTVDLQLSEQYALVHRHKYVVASEGAFFAWLLLAGEGSTWIMVHNHSHPWNEHVRSSNYHAKLVHFFPWVRLVVYVIDNGRREPMSELLRVVRDVQWKGGDVIHIGALQNSRSKYAGSHWPESSTPAHLTLPYMARHRLPVAIQSAESSQPLCVVQSGGQRQVKLSASASKAGGTDFVLVRHNSSFDEFFALALFNDTRLVLSMAANESEAITLAMIDEPSAAVFAVRTRGEYPSIVLEEPRSGRYAQGSAKGLVAASPSVGLWEAWTVGLAVSALSVLERRGTVVALISARHSRPLSLAAPAVKAAACAGVALHASAAMDGAVKLVVVATTSSAFIFGLAGNESLVLSSLPGGQPALCSRGASGATAFRVRRQDQFPSAVLEAERGVFLAATLDGAVGSSQRAEEDETWSVVVL